MGHLQPGTADGLDEAVAAERAVGGQERRLQRAHAARMDGTGAGKVAGGLNDITAADETLGAELARVGRAVGKEGKLSHGLSRHM